jgi:hypothetical protein
MNELIVACISGVFSVIAVVISNNATRNKIQAEIKQELAVHQAVTDTKLDELTREVREHNGFAKRMPVVENEIKHINEKIDEYHK